MENEFKLNLQRVNQAKWAKPAVTCYWIYVVLNPDQGRLVQMVNLQNEGKFELCQKLLIKIAF